jgi:hypothetical protein
MLHLVGSLYNIFLFFFFFLLFFWRCGPWSAFAFSKIVLHCSRSSYLHFQFLTPIIFRSSSTESSHRNLGFPTCRLPSGFRSVSSLQRSNFFIIKPTRCTNFPNWLHNETLHFSGSSSAHHQEFIHFILNGTCHTGL